MSERVAIVFMTLSVVATLAMGGAIAYEFAHTGHTTTTEAAAGVAGQSYTSAPSSDSGAAAPSSDVTSGAPAPSNGSTPVANSAAAPSGGSTASSGNTSP